MLEIFRFTKEFNTEYKYPAGVSLKRDIVELLMLIFRANRRMKANAADKKVKVIVRALSFRENLYDADTLDPQLKQVERLTGKLPEMTNTDRG